MLVALRDHRRGECVDVDGLRFELREDIPAKHKVAARDFGPDDRLKMYGITVGRALHGIPQGGLISTNNLVHATDAVDTNGQEYHWQQPDAAAWRDATFAGYYRADGRVGTRNYWIVVPLVFCENRNVRMMRRAMLESLGYGLGHAYQTQTRRLVELYQNGAGAEAILESSLQPASQSAKSQRVFENIDGVKFLTHHEGCGGAYSDATNLCGLLAGYINHPNVVGATVLSLGCQKSQVDTLQQQLALRNADFDKPLLIFEQQQMASEEEMLSQAIRHTFAGLVRANDCQRAPAALSHLCVGVECGGSDGFSWLSANPSIGHTSDLLVSLGGSVILSEFPELAGCEGELASRCVDQNLAQRFLKLMHAYEQRVVSEGNGFDSNPSPGNVRDGLITDAMKSAGAAKKGGTAPVVDVLDYPQPVTKTGLSLLCTPGGDVESTTAMAGSGATILLFSTGLGTPTGNPVAPTIKIASNSQLVDRLPDLIDLDAGGVISGKETIGQVGERLLKLIAETASGQYVTKAERLAQDDFIPWRRSLTF